MRKILTTSKLHAVSSRLGVQTIKLETHQHTMIMVYAFETLAAVKFNSGTERKAPNQILKLEDSQYTFNELIFKVTSCIGINASAIYR